MISSLIQNNSQNKEIQISQQQIFDNEKLKLPILPVCEQCSKKELESCRYVTHDLFDEEDPIFMNVKTIDKIQTQTNFFLKSINTNSTLYNNLINNIDPKLLNKDLLDGIDVLQKLLKNCADNISLYLTYCCRFVGHKKGLMYDLCFAPTWTQQQKEFFDSQQINKLELKHEEDKKFDEFIYKAFKLLIKIQRYIELKVESFAQHIENIHKKRDPRSLMKKIHILKQDIVKYSEYCRENKYYSSKTEEIMQILSILKEKQCEFLQLNQQLELVIQQYDQQNKTLLSLLQTIQKEHQEYFSKTFKEAQEQFTKSSSYHKILIPIYNVILNHPDKMQIYNLVDMKNPTTKIFIHNNFTQLVQTTNKYLTDNKKLCTEINTELLKNNINYKVQHQFWNLLIYLSNLKYKSLLNESEQIYKESEDMYYYISFYYFETKLKCDIEDLDKLQKKYKELKLFCDELKKKEEILDQLSFIDNIIPQILPESKDIIAQYNNFKNIGISANFNYEQFKLEALKYQELSDKIQSTIDQSIIDKYKEINKQEKQESFRNIYYDFDRLTQHSDSEYNSLKKEFNEITDKVKIVKETELNNNSIEWKELSRMVTLNKKTSILRSIKDHIDRIQSYFKRSKLVNQYMSLINISCPDDFDLYKFKNQVDNIHNNLYKLTTLQESCDFNPHLVPEMKEIINQYNELKEYFPNDFDYEEFKTKAKNAYEQCKQTNKYFQLYEFFKYKTYILENNQQFTNQWKIFSEAFTNSEAQVNKELQKSVEYLEKSKSNFQILYNWTFLCNINPHLVPKMKEIINQYNELKENFPNDFDYEKFKIKAENTYEQCKQTNKYFQLYEFFKYKTDILENNQNLNNQWKIFSEVFKNHESQENDNESEEFQKSVEYLEKSKSNFQILYDLNFISKINPHLVPEMKKIIDQYNKLKENFPNDFDYDEFKIKAENAYKQCKKTNKYVKLYEFFLFQYSLLNNNQHLYNQWKIFSEVCTNPKAQENEEFQKSVEDLEKCKPNLEILQKIEKTINETKNSKKDQQMRKFSEKIEQLKENFLEDFDYDEFYEKTQMASSIIYRKYKATKQDQKKYGNYYEKQYSFASQYLQYENYYEKQYLFASQYLQYENYYEKQYLFASQYLQNNTQTKSILLKFKEILNDQNALLDLSKNEFNELKILMELEQLSKTLKGIKIKHQSNPQMHDIYIRLNQVKNNVSLDQLRLYINNIFEADRFIDALNKLLEQSFYLKYKCCKKNQELIKVFKRLEEFHLNLYENISNLNFNNPEELKRNLEENFKLLRKINQFIQFYKISSNGIQRNKQEDLDINLSIQEFLDGSSNKTFDQIYDETCLVFKETILFQFESLKEKDDMIRQIVQEKIFKQINDINKQECSLSINNINLNFYLNKLQTKSNQHSSLLKDMPNIKSSLDIDIDWSFILSNEIEQTLRNNILKFKEIGYNKRRLDYDNFNELIFKTIYSTYASKYIDLLQQKIILYLDKVEKVKDCFSKISQIITEYKTTKNIYRNFKNFFQIFFSYILMTLYETTAYKLSSNLSRMNNFITDANKLSSNLSRMNECINIANNPQTEEIKLVQNKIQLNVKQENINQNNNFFKQKIKSVKEIQEDFNTELQKQLKTTFCRNEIINIEQNEKNLFTKIDRANAEIDQTINEILNLTKQQHIQPFAQRLYIIIDEFENQIKNSYPDIIINNNKVQQIYNNNIEQNENYLATLIDCTQSNFILKFKEYFTHHINEFSNLIDEINNLTLDQKHQYPPLIKETYKSLLKNQTIVQNIISKLDEEKSLLSEINWCKLWPTNWNINKENKSTNSIEDKEKKRNEITQNTELIKNHETKINALIKEIDKGTIQINELVKFKDIYKTDMTNFLKTYNNGINKMPTQKQIQQVDEINVQETQINNYSKEMICDKNQLNNNSQEINVQETQINNDNHNLQEHQFNNYDNQINLQKQLSNDNSEETISPNNQSDYNSEQIIAEEDQFTKNLLKPQNIKFNINNTSTVNEQSDNIDFNVQQLNCIINNKQIIVN